MAMDFLNKCPMCATEGKLWHREPVVYHCPNCTSMFSRFGIVLERQKEHPELWN